MLIPTIPSGEVFESDTHYFYLGVILLTFSLCFIKFRKHRDCVLWLPMVILWIIAVSRDFVGADYIPYYGIFNGAKWDGYIPSATNIEPGYYYLNAFLHQICSYEFFGFMAIHFLTLFFTYKAITYFKKDISFAYAILAYVTMWYFLSFNLLRICLAAAIVSWSIRFLLEKHYWKYFTVIGLLFFIHMSSAAMILPGIAYITYQKSPKLTIIGLVAFLVIINGFLYILLQNISILRYQHYLSTDSGTGIGLNIFFTYVPFAYWLCIGRKRIDKNLWQLCLVFTLFAFIIDFSGYRLEILGRLRTYAVVPFLIYLPVLIQTLKKFQREKYVLNSIAIFIYLIAKYYLLLPQLYWSDKIMPYHSMLFD